MMTDGAKKKKQSMKKQFGSKIFIPASGDEVLEIVQKIGLKITRVQIQTRWLKGATPTPRMQTLQHS
jgi:hypothetical protein